MIKKISVFLLLTTLFSFSLGFDIPKPNGFINDLTNTLTTEQKDQISNLVENIKQTTSTQIAVLIVPTIDGDDVNLLAADIGNKWGVGEKGKDNGIMMLFAMQDRSWSIQVGYGLEGTIPDAIAKRIGENNIVPNFRNGDYFQGIYGAINDVYSYIQKDPTTIESYSTNSSSSNSGSNSDFDWQGVFTWLIWMFFIASAVIGKSIIPKSKRKDKKKRLKAILIIGGIGVLLGLMAGAILGAVIAGYLGMLLGVFGKSGNGGGSIGGGGFSSGGSSGGSSFGGGSFGGGGGGGKR